MRYESKTDLLDQVLREREALKALIDSIPSSRRAEPGAWGDGWTVGDLLAHLAEWHRMFLGWFREGLGGAQPELPAPGYKWNETPRLNHDIWAKYKEAPFSNVLEDFNATFEDVHQLLQGLSEAELLEPGHFDWTGKNALVTYAGANTASHYRFAQKVLKRWLRNSSERGTA